MDCNRLRRIIIAASVTLLPVWSAFPWQEPDTVMENPADTATVPLPAATDTVAPGEDLPNETALDNGSVTIEGLVLDSVTGMFPAKDGINVYIDSLSVPIDSQGNFVVTLPRASGYYLAIYSGDRRLFAERLFDDPEKSNVFVTCMVSRKKSLKTEAPGTTLQPTAGIPWTIAGCIVDSRLDLALSSSGASLTFDDSLVMLSPKGSFAVSTRYPGTHTFHLRVPGYHEVYETVVLTEADKQPFVTLATTASHYALKRREITVSAKRQPLHITSKVATVNISRKQLQQSTATINDPVRALNTLPGVAAESDVSAMPVVRGGDLQEARVFLDGISLLQPFHFGGMRSMFNTFGVENLTLHKSGFPAEYHNAQSGLIVVESRSPARDSAVVSGDINLLQYCAYAALPFKKNTLGLSLATQGSYFDFMTKRVMDVVAWGVEDTFIQQNIKEAKSLVNQPDYQDYAASFEWRPNDRFNLSIREMLATDKMWYTFADSVTPVTCYYSNKLYYYDHFGQLRIFDGPTGDPIIDARLRDTSFSYTYKRSNWDMGSTPFGLYPDSIKEGRSFYEIDTAMYYKAAYNLLYAKGQYLRTPDQVFNFSLAWQKRWWDLVFPEAMSDVLDTSRYDVNLDQWNVHAGVLYSGKDNHLIKGGLQWDLTYARYDVFTFRMLHEIISKGSTNFGDYWGPVTGDSGFSIGSNQVDGSLDMIGRLLVSYKGRSLYHSGNLYGEDEWTPTPRLTCNYGGRIEISESDTSVTFSPRASLKYQWKPDHELIAAAGLYTQNNYDVAALALSKDLKPEKVWHASAGMESRLLPWLTQKIDLYGKYYFDLTSEEIMPAGDIDAAMLARADAYIDSLTDIGNIDSLKHNAPGEYARLVMAYLIQNELFSSHFSNEGRGWAAGGEYFLRYDPADFWDGWISVTLGKSMRQRHTSWRWHDFPYERPLLVSLVNYYRLPRKFEIGLKYRFMSGIPYTPYAMGERISIGRYNSRRYGPYQSLDLKLSKGFTVWGKKGHFYIEAWNMLNSPNMMLHDSKTRELQMIGMNMPLSMLFVGFDFNN
ncbi:MAG: TonB-dependent receptor [Chitinispirillaceae bacterium]|nr:TonB-dependent receptor [Chitinispirillaceae bacterium]